MFVVSFAFVVVDALCEGTRLKVIDDHIYVLEQQLRELAAGSEKKFEVLSAQIEAIHAKRQG